MPEQRSTPFSDSLCETVKIEAGPILKPLGRAYRDQPPLFHGPVSPKTTFNEASGYVPDSFSG